MSDIGTGSNNEAHLLSFEPMSVKFLNSQKVAVSGNDPRGKVQILSSSFQNINEIKFPKCLLNNIEICGISTQARSCVAVINREIQLNHSFISLLDIDLFQENYPIKLSSTLHSSNYVNSCFTSLSFYLHQTNLATSTEIGDICVFDISADKEVYNFCADACGVYKVLFNRSGQILTLGNSKESQLRLWDTRQTNSDLVTSIVKSFSHPKHHQKSAHVVYSFAQFHKSLPIVYCGSNDGHLFEWDLRFDSTTPTSTTLSHSDEITGILCHPYEDNMMISSSLDGTVKVNNIYNNTNETIVSESSSITSIDCNMDSGVLIASSALGTLVSRQLR